MMRQTGGTAVGEISTRSSPFCLAMASACGGGMMPSCWPVSSITRISRTRMRSLTRTRSSRRGLLENAIKPPTTRPASALGGLRHRGADGGQPSLDGDLVARFRHERGDRRRPLIAAGPLPNRDGVLGRLAVAYDEHVGDLLQLSLTNLISDLFLPLVERCTQ